MKVDDGDGLLTVTPMIHSRARAALQSNNAGDK